MSSLTRGRGNHTHGQNHTHARIRLIPALIALVFAVFGARTVAGAQVSGVQIPSTRVSGEPRLEDWLAQLHGPGEPLVSVALSRSGGLTPDFAHPYLSLTAPQGLFLIDPNSGAVLLETAPGETVAFASRSGAITAVLAGLGKESQPLEPLPVPASLPLSSAGALVVARQIGEPITVLELTRPGSGPYARYRGALLVVPADRPDSLWLMNQVGLEAYLRGVVPVEMPASFSLEALKAQAVIARTYSLYQLGNGRTYLNGLARLCDGTSCQAYYGAGAERARSDQAVEETTGIVITYAGQLIPTYYSSTAGGHTESAALLWGNGTVDAAQPADRIPYLRGVPDYPEWADFDDEERFRQFLTERPASFDDGSPYYRWQYSWTREDLEEYLGKTLKELPARVASFIARPASVLPEQPSQPGQPGQNDQRDQPYRADQADLPDQANKLGEPGELLLQNETEQPAASRSTPAAYLQDILPVQRGVSGRLLTLQIVTAEGIWTIQGELNIRRLFPVPKLGLLPSSAAIVELERDPSGIIRKVTLKGTGSGHGVGLSQYGADGMARRGYQFTDIVTHYFPGTQTQLWYTQAAIDGAADGNEVQTAPGSVAEESAGT